LTHTVDILNGTSTQLGYAIHVGLR